MFGVVCKRIYLSGGPGGNPRRVCAHLDSLRRAGHDEPINLMRADRDGASPMTRQDAGFDEAALAGSTTPAARAGGLRTRSLLALFAWCGLVTGLLEAGITVVRKQYFSSNHFDGMSRHSVWLVPLADVLLFVVAGAVLSLVVRWRAGSEGTAWRILATLALLPLIWSAFPRIFGAAGLLLAMGLAFRLVPIIERHRAGFGRFVRQSFPVAAMVLVVLAASCWLTDQVKLWREESRPLPPSACPNIVLIVLDTVGAGHLGLLGYGRPTSPTIDDLASRGICFKRAQATTSWTLPSHASMFTGRWPHEVSAGWFTPLDAASPTVAEYLGAQGYATAGFVANLAYCATDSGLARGFATYRDFIFPQLTALYLTTVVGRVVDGIQGVESAFTYAVGDPILRSPADFIWKLFGKGRKEAAVVNREFLDWLSRRSGRTGRSSRS